MHNKYIITYECHDNAPRMWKLEKYFDFSLLSITSLLSAPEREVTSPSDFKVVGALYKYMANSLSCSKYNSLNYIYVMLNLSRHPSMPRGFTYQSIYGMYFKSVRINRNPFGKKSFKFNPRCTSQIFNIFH